MESLPKDILLEFNPNTLEAVRKEFNLDKPGRIDEAIDILDDWVKKQNHFKKKDFTREYLERTIISCKGLVERAKTRIDKLCTFKTLMPNFFKNTEAIEEFSELHDKFVLLSQNALRNFVPKTGDDMLGSELTIWVFLQETASFRIHAHLPKMTPDHYRVYFCKLITKDDTDAAFIFTYYKYVIMISEYMKMHEYTNGYILVLDYTDANLMSLVTRLNIVELRQALTLLMDGYGMRLKGLHIITPSKAITTFVSILKQVLSEKLGGRIHSHKAIDTVYEYVPKRILPAEYGGEERSLKKLNEDWQQVFNTEEYTEYLKEMNEAKTVESCRQANKLTEQYIGVPGSFRSLSVD